MVTSVGKIPRSVSYPEGVDSGPGPILHPCLEEISPLVLLNPADKQMDTGENITSWEQTREFWGNWSPKSNRKSTLVIFLRGSTGLGCSLKAVSVDWAATDGFWLFWYLDNSISWNLSNQPEVLNPKLLIRSKTYPWRNTTWKTTKESFQWEPDDNYTGSRMLSTWKP